MKVLPRAYCGRMKLHGVRPALAVAVFAAAVLAACGGGGGGGGGTVPGDRRRASPTPTPPVPTATPRRRTSSKAPPASCTLGSNAANAFSSSMLERVGGRNVRRSKHRHAGGPAAALTLTEYNVTASESAAGVTSSTSQGAHREHRRTRGHERASLPFRPRLDPRTARARSCSTAGRRWRSSTAVADVQSVAPRQQLPRRHDHATFHVQQGTITGVGGTCNAPKIQVGACYIDVPATVNGGRSARLRVGRRRDH